MQQILKTHARTFHLVFERAPVSLEACHFLAKTAVLLAQATAQFGGLPHFLFQGCEIGLEEWIHNAL